MTKLHNTSTITFKDREFVKVSTELAFTDRIGTWKARWDMGRMHYFVEPGLYAIGDPTDISDVLVSANYKMSFDRLRASMAGRDAWILVLDTDGINVWCAAGKGTFGTDELVKRIEDVKLGEIISHKTLIVPQLGAPSVAAHTVRELSGFGVVFGPVRCEDLPAFIDAGYEATPGMRRIEFPLADRMVLIPVEIVFGFKYLIYVGLVVFLLSGFAGEGLYSSDMAMTYGLSNVKLLLFVFMIPVVLGPVLLPWLPGRAFCVKGLWIGLAMDAFLLWRILQLSRANPGMLCELDWFLPGAWLLVMPALASFVVMNYTGTTTYTSLSGVKKEMKVAIPLQAIAVVVASAFWIASLFV
ncbi:MAG: acetyl-CoA synthase subunit gamma [Planctomycetes bacterium]|nr:acetyl-CoA synthase subunit gamma [Planctomycetota bacterium]